MGGRGAGKTRAGAEWLRAQAESGRRGRFALVGATLSDVREVMVGGESGLIAIAPKDMRPHYEVSRRRLVWPNGAEARAFSAEDPDSLRGPQFDAAWCDEFAAWAKQGAALTVLDMGLRIGADPRAVITTTPKPTPAMWNLLRMNGLVLSKASTTDNAANLAPGFLHSVTERYGGTDLARQELDGEMIEDLPGAVFRQAWIRRVRPNEMPELRRIVVAVDPPAGGGPKSDECGIVVAGATYDGEPRGYVLADWSFRADGPDDWARRAMRAFDEFKADCVIAEANQGGDMVRTILAKFGAACAVTMVRATRGKTVRATPVAMAYQRGEVAHVGVFAELEEQMRSLSRDKDSGADDRVDALVWALTDLIVKPSAEPSVRGL